MKIIFHPIFVCLAVLVTIALSLQMSRGLSGGRHAGQALAQAEQRLAEAELAERQAHISYEIATQQSSQDYNYLDTFGLLLPEEKKLTLDGFDYIPSISATAPPANDVIRQAWWELLWP